MKTTYMANSGNVERKWYVIDGAGKPLGRIAAIAAAILRGKHKPTFTPHVDAGDHVIIINAEKVILTGRKLDQKMYTTHSGYISGLKQTPYRKFMQTNPEKAVLIAVKGMLPHNSLGSAMASKLKVYRGAEHKHQAQNPELWQLEM